MWQSKEDEEKQRQLEKLIDWELNKQLAWVVLVLTFFLGAIQLLASGLLKSSEAISFKSSFLTIQVYANTPFIIIYAFMIFGLDISFYRLATTAYTMRNLVEMLPSELQQKELKERRTPMGWFYEQLIKRTDKNRFSLKTWLVLLLIVLGDILLIWALVSAA